MERIGGLTAMRGRIRQRFEGLTFIFPITVAIVILLGIVYFSYRQTIAAYPTGGGSYTVARENLGANAGLLAAPPL
jgi:amino acid transporter